MRAFEYRHVVGFEETNLVGNVYFANHVRWQGRAREAFLREHAPEILGQLATDLALVTTRVSCEYFRELFAFDEVLLRMRAGAVGQNRVTMLFDYLRVGDRSANGSPRPSEELVAEELVAQGEQQIACMRRSGAGMVATPIPEALRRALESYLTAD